MKEKIKVLIVDDSAVVRQTLAKLLKSDPMIEVVGTASDPYVAATKISQVVPDVITLDVEMPRMDGLTFLRKLMAQHPIPVVIISSLTAAGTESALRALEYGAVDILTKPTLHDQQSLQDSTTVICEAVKAAAHAKLRRIGSRNVPGGRPLEVAPKLSTDAVLRSTPSRSMLETTEKVIVVGASTGGTEALRTFLEQMPLDAPGIVVVQHMPEQFTRSFANRLNEICPITVKEAENGDRVIPGRALIAPGNRHTLLKRSGAQYYVEVMDGPLVNRHRPSVDVLFRSAANYAGKNCVGILMTGMGDDGARGLLEMKEAGAKTIAQNEQSCVVFGMPKEAIRLNAVDKVLSIEQIAPHAITLAKR
ncbi:MAG: chemotaxis response regulator protein-glutamate methylesterase [Ferruginibacter sp.]|nr:chemotaxis response regulator protein-glutamate methylesterase [Cytophagales bacterium]